MKGCTLLIVYLPIFFVDVAYVTMSKASEAALGIEQVNGKALDGCSRPLKVDTAFFFKKCVGMFFFQGF
jgi:hypothetical protein